MLISTQTASFADKFGDHDAVKMLARVGYDALDYSMFNILTENSPINKPDYREYAESLKRTADENNVIFNQSHAPFPSYIKDKQDYNEIIVYAIVKAMEVTSIIGGKIVIVHPITFFDGDNKAQKEFNMNFFNMLLPYCKIYGVKIALENMYAWDDKEKRVTPGVCSPPHEFADYLDSLDKNWFCACLDIGHCEMQGTGAVSAVDSINALGRERLQSLHIHDNDKIKDTHTLPFMQKIKWEEIMQALKNINYTGDFTFEADNFLAVFPPELYMNASTLMLDVGRYLTSL